MQLISPIILAGGYPDVVVEGEGGGQAEERKWPAVPRRRNQQSHLLAYCLIYYVFRVSPVDEETLEIGIMWIMLCPWALTRIICRNCYWVYYCFGLERQNIAQICLYHATSSRKDNNELLFPILLIIVSNNG